MHQITTRDSPKRQPITSELQFNFSTLGSCNCNKCWQTKFSELSENTNSRLLPKQSRTIYLIHQSPTKDWEGCNSLAVLTKDREQCFHIQQSAKNENRHLLLSVQAKEHRPPTQSNSSQNRIYPHQRRVAVSPRVNSRQAQWACILAFKKWTDRGCQTELTTYR